MLQPTSPRDYAGECTSLLSGINNGVPEWENQEMRAAAMMMMMWPPTSQSESVAGYASVSAGARARRGESTLGAVQRRAN